MANPPKHIVAQRMKRAVLIFPTLTERESIDAVRSRFDPLADKIAPHITLVFPFVDEMTDAELASHVEVVSGQVEAFALTFGPPETRDDYLWLPVREGAKRLHALHTALYAGGLRRHLRASSPYVPHLTLARASGERLREALIEVRDFPAETAGFASAIVVERILPDESSDEIATLRLR